MIPALMIDEHRVGFDSPARCFVFQNEMEEKQMKNHQPVRKYDIWSADLPAVPGSHVQCGKRPVVVVSNDTANCHSPIISVIPLTSNLGRMNLPTHTMLRSRFLRCPSMALCEQIMTIDKMRLIDRIGAVECLHERLAIRHCVKVQLGLVA